ncbi:hypothetical protein HYT18_00685 [Candidatus Microgenomates bacterium]|nr:hypothetical protein [Candidatus Microgenomates bacterium]
MSIKQQHDDVWSKSWDFIGNFPRTISTWIERKTGRKVAFIFVFLIILIACLIIFFIKAGDLIDGVNSVKSLVSMGISNQTPLPINEPEISPSSMASQTPLDEERVKGIVARPCEGIPVEIILEFNDVEGKEKFVYPDPHDLSVVAAPESDTFQAAKRYQFDCSLPWIATFSAIPRKNQSIGIFLEFEEVFRILIGDGDRLTWKVEKNDSGRKEKWAEVTRRKLGDANVTLDKQITVTLEATYKAGFIYLVFKMNYLPEGEVNYRWVEYKDILFKPLAINLEDSFNQAQKFRIGINDYRFKGKGSEVKFGKFSVKTMKRQ